VKSELSRQTRKDGTSSRTSSRRTTRSRQVRRVRTARIHRAAAGRAQDFALDLSLKAPGVTEAITVEASAGTLELSSARNGVNVTPREVESLPVNGRQMSQLLLQAPGAVNSGSGTWQDIRFSAVRWSRTPSATTVSKAPRSSTRRQAT
jgi:hypothetical protein